ncbi:MAG: SDR family NAD(P)-dependent oxidoreductase [Dehalococcoidia bacterium]|nr:SDR family NAD(P)-dependent oxidoreductase [Dehalococcoidia bacterium]
MRDFHGRVAVVTGAASGIGRGLAARFAAEGMKVVLADVEKEALVLAAAELEQQGADVLAVETDVASRESVDALRDAAIEHFGRVHVLCNNAGVAGGGGGPLWTATPNDWKWVVDVNLMGVVHGIQSFIPAMLDHGEEGHIVNTSSVLGLGTGGGSVYGVTKHAVTRLTEGLYYDLQAAGANLGVSVLCPGLIATRIIEADRNRPPALRDDVQPTEEMQQRRRASVEHWARDGMPPEEVAEIVLEAVRERRFYILTHPAYRARVEERMRAILDGSPPPPLPSPEAALGAVAMPARGAGDTAT